MVRLWFSLTFLPNNVSNEQRGSCYWTLSYQNMWIIATFKGWFVSLVGSFCELTFDSSGQLWILLQTRGTNSPCLRRPAVVMWPQSWWSRDLCGIHSWPDGGNVSSWKIAVGNKKRLWKVTIIHISFKSIGLNVRFNICVRKYAIVIK